MKIEKFDADGALCQLLGSHNGKAWMRVVMYRTLRNGTRRCYDVELTVSRSSVGCIYRAIEAFAQAELTEAQAVRGFFK